MGFLYQIEAKQSELRKAYDAKHGKKPVVVAPALAVVPSAQSAEEPVIVAPKRIVPKRTVPTEQLIAVTLPVSLHTRIAALMAADNYKGSKKEFVASLLDMVFNILEAETTH